MKSRLVYVAAIAAVMTMLVATLGFTLFTADRDVEANIVPDDEGILALDPNDDIDVVFLDDGEELAIDLGEFGSNGINPEARLELGKADFFDTPAGARDVDEAAYTITNTRNQQAQVELEYAFDDPSQVTDSDVVLSIDQPGGHITKEAGREANFTLGSSETAEVAIAFKTGTTADDISGTLRHEAITDQ